MATATRPPDIELPELPAPGRAFRFNWVETFMWSVRVFALFFILWGLVGAIGLSLSGEGLSADAWEDLLVAAAAQGSMYGLIALGYSMVYGVLGFINFAHGEVFMSGAMVGYFVADAFFDAGVWESNFAVAMGFVIIASVFTSTVTAVLIERVAYRPLRNAPRLIPLITSLGVSFFIQNAVLGLVGPAVKTYPPMPEWLSKKYQILGIGIEGSKILVIAVALVSMVGLWMYVTRTRTGRSIRAVAEDKEIAALMGINVERTIVATFAVGGAMAGVAGVLWAILFRGVSAFTGFIPGIKAFTAAVLGGVGNIIGAFVGGLVLGLFEGVAPNVVLRGLSWEIPIALGATSLIAAVAVFVVGYARKRRALMALGAVFGLVAVASFVGFTIVIPGLSQLKDAVAFTALVLVLMFRPSGLLGEQLSEEDRV